MPRRLALLVATYRYQDAGLRQLAAPGHDAEALAEVLRNPEIANFDVTVLVNEPHHVVGDAIGEFYHNRRRDDLTLLYFTGHGLKDDHGRLYLAMTNTKRDRLLFTGLPAQQIDEAMESCSSRQKVLILDCCYSGAFPAGRTTKSDPQVNSLEKFQGKGRVVLTASDATQYSFEGNHVIGQGTQSVFTRFLVEGLTTGEADLDSDGDISLDELYSYVHDRVTQEMPQQRPKKQENIEGRIVIARNTHWSLPAHVRNAIESPSARDRLAVLESLAHLHRVGNDLVRATAIHQTQLLIHDDSKAVSTAAMELITTLTPDQGRQEADEQTRRKADEQTRRETEETDRRHTEEQAQRETEVQRRRKTEEARWGPAVTSTPPHRSAEEQDERPIATSPVLPPPVAGTTARSYQLEPSAHLDPRTGTANEKQPPRSAGQETGEQTPRKADSWTAVDSTDSTSPPRSQQIRRETAGHHATGPQVGRNLGLANSWRLGHFTRPKMILAAAALVISFLIVVLVSVTTNPGTTPNTRPAPNTVTATIPVGDGPGGAAVASDGLHAYVTNLGSNNMSVIDTASNTVTTTIPLGSQPGHNAVKLEA